MTKTISDIVAVKNLPTKKKTYLEVLEEHIATLTEEEKETDTDMMLLVGVGKDIGNFFSVLQGDSVVSAIGLLEITKIVILESQDYTLINK